MKKILAVILTFSISLGFSFAQDSQPAEAAEPESNGKYLGFIKDMRAGSFFNVEPAAGDLSEFVFSSIGGGASFEAGIPLPLFGELPFVHGLLENFGASFRMAFDGGIMKETNIDSIFSMRYTLGAYTRIPLPGNMFSIVPEIDYGLVFNLPKASGDGSKYVNSVYVDQVLQFGAGVRFSHPKMTKGNLEFEFTPTYSLSPESGSSVHYIGFRFGALYKFADRSHNLSSESKEALNNSENTEISQNTENSEPELIQLTPELTQKKDGLSERAENLRIAFASLVEDAEENHLKKLAKKYKGYEKQVEKIIEEINSVDSEESLAAAEAKLNQLEGKIGNLEKTEEEAEVELDIAVTEGAAKTGHAALIHHPDDSYTIAIPPLTFEANSIGLVISEQNKKSMDTLIEVLKTDERISGMIVSVYGYINPDSRSEYWTEEEKILAKGRAETISKYLSDNGCDHRVDAHAGIGYTDNAVFNRRVEFLVHN